MLCDLIASKEAGAVFYVEGLGVWRTRRDVATPLYGRPPSLQFYLTSRTALTRRQSKNMISSTSFVTKWYITLFANTVPFQTQLRLWDAFLLEGRDVLVVTAVAILWVVKGAAEQCREASIY